jgi:tetratricopeptide (TPR) repeat protein
MNLPDIAKAYFDSTRIILEKALQENTEDYRIIGSIGIAFAGLGYKKEAIEFGQRALDLYSVDMDAFGGLIRVADLAWIYVLLEEYDAALEKLEFILSKHGPYSAALLKLDPIWKPLWDHPDFVSLTEKYSKKGSKDYDS